jgi:hypothetical protein
VSSNPPARYGRALHPARLRTTKWFGALVAAMVTPVCLATLSDPAQAATAHTSNGSDSSHTSHGSGSSHSSSPAPPHAKAATGKHAGVAGTQLSTATPGYWLASGHGAVGSYGGAPFHSSLGSVSLTAPVVALAPAPDGRGYWLAAADGGVFAFGDAVFHGSTAGRRLDAPVVGMASTPSGHGYWLVGSDGGVYSFGDAAYAGSLSGHHLAAPVVALAPTHDGHGYWLAAADGGVFSFGNAVFHGSSAGRRLDAAVRGMAATPSGMGYWLVGSDGGVYSFGDAGFAGSLSGHPLTSPVVALSPTHDGRGYWLAGADGGVFAFGDATFRGSASGNVPSGDGVVVVAAGPGVTNVSGASGDFSAPPAPRSVGTDRPGTVGFDISWPQCSGPYPAPSAPAIVGVNDGTAFTGNPCFAPEAAWAGSNLSVYMNLNAPDPTNPSQFASGPAGVCSPGAASCDSFNYGYNAAADALKRAHLAGPAPREVWLDVETGNAWSADTGLNDQVISGAVTELRAAGATPGIYSTGYQYSVIAGSFKPSTAEWLATGVALNAPSPACAAPTFTGGRVTLVQGSLGPFDGDYAC